MSSFRRLDEREKVPRRGNIWEYENRRNEVTGNADGDVTTTVLAQYDSLGIIKRVMFGMDGDGLWSMKLWG